jgi:ribosome-binding factor A
MRYTPELHFVFDRQVEKIEAMEKLFQEIARERGDSDE